jgi:hypothetical protein
MIAQNPTNLVRRELDALGRWLDRHWSRRTWGSHRGVESGWRSYHPAGGDVPLPPAPRVDLYRDRDKLVLTPERERR